MVRSSRLIAPAVAALFAAGCASRGPVRQPAPDTTPLAARVQAPGLLFDVVYTRADSAEVAHLTGLLLATAQRLSRWGSFRQGVEIRVFPDHASLERAAQKKDLPWLRAWAYQDLVLLESPRTWDEPSRAARDERLFELLVHELTHSLVYQLTDPSDPPGVAIEPREEPPLWFTEGIASVTAGQRRLSGEELTAFVAGHPGTDLLHPTAEQYRSEKEAVYGAAHRAFALLVALSGDQAVRDVLRGVRAGALFSDAFKAATGHSLADFEREAIRSGFDPLAARFSPSGAGGP